MTDPLATGDWSAPTRADPERPVVPGYEIHSELGRGGMGVVYKARQEKHDRFVALKLLRDGALAGPKDRARFRAEAEAASRLQHPNVVAVHEVGTYSGLPYFAMELVESGSLDQYLRGQPQPAPRAAELIRTLAAAIQHAHDFQIVHRDLKPSNILLSAEPTTGAAPLVPKVSDFGLAKRLDSDSTVLTQDGAVLGTASYMAPEQAAGRVREIGPAVDIYALGAVLYELLTGQPPFRGETWNETVDQVLYDEPVAPSRLRADVPRELETICLKCLEKDPTRRYATADALANDLGRFLQGAPVVAVPINEAERLARFAARDGFQIVGEIGRGPRSVVYRAQFGPTKQVVALKVFASGVCSREEWDARTARGGQQAAALSHPQVVLVHRTGWWDGAPFAVMDLVPHGNLTTLRGEKRYPLRDALHLVAQLTEIICYLHRQGIVHGNLKPTNVLLAADGIPRVADFQPTAGLNSALSFVDDQDVPGVAYLAPELLEPKAEARLHTDVYGLGAILYELLTNRPVASGSTAIETRDTIRTQEPAPPSNFNSEVTPGVEQVCMRCLRKDPWRRYPRAYDLLLRLRQLHEDPSTPVEPWGLRRRQGHGDS